jgi:hypothetical protein
MTNAARHPRLHPVFAWAVCTMTAGAVSTAPRPANARSAPVAAAADVDAPAGEARGVDAPADPAVDGADDPPDTDADISEQDEPVADTTEPEPEPASASHDEAEPEPAPDDEAASEPEPEVAPAPEPEPESDVAPPLSRLQTAGWWTLFGGFAIGTTAGVFAGLAERQEDRALRLATLFDATTGKQPVYADEQDDYERYLRRGRAYQRTAIGLAAVTGATVVAAIVLFAVDASRRRTPRGTTARRRVRMAPRAGGWEVRF